jgi:hypothetical protein
MSEVEGRGMLGLGVSHRDKSYSLHVSYGGVSEDDITENAITLYQNWKII